MATGQKIFDQLCDAIKKAGLPWTKFAGITTDEAPAMTGSNNGLVALVKKTERGGCGGTHSSALNHSSAGPLQQMSQV